MNFLSGTFKEIRIKYLHNRKNSIILRLLEYKEVKRYGTDNKRYYDW